MGSWSDAELLRRLRAGEDAALDVILERFEKPLFLFLLGTLRDHHAAEDALQDTFIQALQQLDAVDPEHLRGWLFTVAYHQAMLTRRKRAARARHFPAATTSSDSIPADPLNDPAELAISREEADRCRQWLDQLPEPQREVIRQRLYEGKRFRDIAADLGCPLNTALARMHQGLKKLRLLQEKNHVG
jgi:RNA polymerase sigma-70 factor (ECF subfamily)